LEQEKIAGGTLTQRGSSMVGGPVTTNVKESPFRTRGRLDLQETFQTSKDPGVFDKYLAFILNDMKADLGFDPKRIKGSLGTIVDSGIMGNAETMVPTFGRGKFAAPEVNFNVEEIDRLIRIAAVEGGGITPALEMYLRSLVNEEYGHASDLVVGGTMGISTNVKTGLPPGKGFSRKMAVSASNQRSIGVSGGPVDNPIAEIVNRFGDLETAKRMYVFESTLSGIVKDQPAGKASLEALSRVRNSPLWKPTVGPPHPMAKGLGGAAYYQDPAEVFGKQQTVYTSSGPRALELILGGPQQLQEWEELYVKARNQVHQAVGEGPPPYKSTATPAPGPTAARDPSFLPIFTPPPPRPPLKQVERAGPGAPIPAFRREGVGTGGMFGGGNVPIMGQRGEFMIRKSAADALGTNFLNDLNKYHSGGLITAAGPSGGGGSGSGGGAAMVDIDAITNALRTEFSTLVSGLQQAAAGIGAAGDKISNAEIKGTLSHKQEVNVSHNGAQVFNSMGEQFAGLANNAMQGALDQVSDTLGMARTPRSGTTANIPGKSKNTRTG
jgi:hypothetical protein